MLFFILALESNHNQYLSTQLSSILYRAPSCFGDLNAAVAIAPLAPSLPFFVDLNINHAPQPSERRLVGGGGHDLSPVL